MKELQQIIESSYKKQWLKLLALYRYQVSLLEVLLSKELMEDARKKKKEKFNKGGEKGAEKGKKKDKRHLYYTELASTYLVIIVDHAKVIAQVQHYEELVNRLCLARPSAVTVHFFCFVLCFFNLKRNGPSADFLVILVKRNLAFFHVQENPYPISGSI